MKNRVDLTRDFGVYAGHARGRSVDLTRDFGVYAGSRFWVCTGNRRFLNVTSRRHSAWGR